MAGQSGALRVSFHTAAPSVRVAAAGDVVAQELAHQVVLAGAAWVTGHADDSALRMRPSACLPSGRIGMDHHPNQQRGSVVLVRKSVVTRCKPRTRPFPFGEMAGAA